MGKHHTTPLLLTAAAGLLTACTPRAWPLITGTLLLVGLLLITLLASKDQRTPLVHIVVLLCILRRIDPRPYLRLPEPARQDALQGATSGQIPAPMRTRTATRSPGATRNPPIEDRT